jgi:phosphoglycerate dehydrogenase-like enzyme
LRKVERLIATPHIGFVTNATYEIFYREAVEDIAAWLNGKPIRILEPPK